MAVTLTAGREVSGVMGEVGRTFQGKGKWGGQVEGGKCDSWAKGGTTGGVQFCWIQNPMLGLMTDKEVVDSVAAQGWPQNQVVPLQGYFPYLG